MYKNRKTIAGCFLHKWLTNDSTVLDGSSLVNGWSDGNVRNCFLIHTPYGSELWAEASQRSQLCNMSHPKINRATSRILSCVFTYLLSCFTCVRTNTERKLALCLQEHLIWLFRISPEQIFSLFELHWLNSSCWNIKFYFILFIVFTGTVLILAVFSHSLSQQLTAATPTTFWPIRQLLRVSLWDILLTVRRNGVNISKCNYPRF